MPRSVKCPHCGESFLREEEPFEIVGNRYFHKKCFDEIQKAKERKQEEKEAKNKIHDKMSQLCGGEYRANRINEQIKTYTTEYKMTITGIYKTLCYWYDVKGGDPHQAHGGIGIVPHIYRDAKQYYKKKAEREERKKKAALEILLEEKELRDNTERVVVTKRPVVKKPRRTKMFNLD